MAAPTSMPARRGAVQYTAAHSQQPKARRGNILGFAVGNRIPTGKGRSQEQKRLSRLTLASLAKARDSCKPSHSLSHANFGADTCPKH
eukprot:5490608-Amphidinium_carterae.4